MESRLAKLRVANELLADRQRLRAVFDQDGYLFFRDVLDRDAVLDVGRQVTRTLGEQGFAKPGQSSPVWTGEPLTSAGEVRLQELFSAQQLWERLVAVPAVAAFFAKVAGAPVGFIPLARFRVMPPGETTQVHQDGLLNPGFEMTTAWIPLMGIGEELGGLAVAAGSHRQGCQPAEELPPLDGRWRWDVYEPGDVVLMHEALVHTGLANRSRDGVRLSVDVRYQDPAAPAAVVGRIVEVEASSVRIESEAGAGEAGEAGEVVRLGVDDSTLLRADTGSRIALADLLTSELAPGRRVIASRRDGRAVMIKPL